MYIWKYLPEWGVFIFCPSQEVRTQAVQTSPPNVDPLVVLRDLFDILDWSLRRCRGSTSLKVHSLFIPAKY